MLVALPLLTFLFLLLGFHRSMGWRASFFVASLPWALWIAFVTELLTQFRALTRTNVAWMWLIFCIACAVWMLHRVRSIPPHVAEKSGPLSWIDRIALIGIAGIAALVGITGLASAPNNWDAMEYHLPRIVEWIGNRGVQFFPTIDWSQLCQPPFAEYVMLHFDLLSGSDRLLSLVQWFAYVGCIVGATLIVKELGGNRRSQIFGAVIATTVPSALLGASSTKNDCVAAYWICASVYFLLRWRNRRDVWSASAIGITLGMAVFTKGTSFVLLPAIVLACLLMWDRAAQIRALKFLPSIAAIAVLICVPLWIRNYQYTGSPLGLTYFYGVGSVNGRMFGTTHVTPRQTLANGIRNVALHAGVPSERINALSTRAFSGAIRAIGVDPNDPNQIVASQLGYTPRFEVRFNPRNEVLSEDPLHLLLFLIACALLVVHRRQTNRDIQWFGTGIIGAAILYCALLRWSPWNTRYQIPLFVLAAAFTAIVLDRFCRRWTIVFCGSILVLYALPLALMNETRPLITAHGLRGGTLTTPRDETYFFDSHRELASSWIDAANAAKQSGCHSFALDANLEHFEYPMMAMLQDGSIYPQIRYVDVENSSARYSYPPAQPACMVICLNCLNHPEKFAQYSRTLSHTQTFGAVVLFSEAGNPQMSENSAPKP